MNRMLALLGAVVFLVAAAPSTGAAQANNGDANVTTIWDGVFTEEQARRGEQAFRQDCGTCHAPSEWATPMFLGSYSGRSVFDIYENLRMTMPFDGPGRLTPQQYSDIVAYMLKLNDVPVGSDELPTVEAGLRKITVTRGEND